MCDYRTACHIVPHRYLFADPAGWEEQYLDSCYAKEDGINDVRNGIEMCETWHKLFDNYSFTTRLTTTGNARKYKIEFSKLIQFSVGDKKRDNQELIFSGPSDQWPGAKFLEYHNRNFEARMRRVLQLQAQAQAEPKEYSKQDSDRTIDYHFESLDYRQGKWVKCQPEEYDSWEEDEEMAELENTYQVK